MKSTNLTHVSDALTNRNTYDIIVKKCPRLISLELNEPTDQNILETLSEDFHCLKQLQFQKIECSHLQQNRITSSSLCWQSIKLKNAIGSLNLNKIFEIAANLQSLNCEKTEIIYWNLNQSNMRLLENVELIYCEFRYSPQLCKFIQFALRTVRKLLIDNCTQLSDTDFIKDENNVVNDLKLEDLLIQNAEDLTVKTAEYFIKTIPKLRRLGSLDKWNINENDLQCLRNTAQNYGKCIELVTSNV